MSQLTTMTQEELDAIIGAREPGDDTPIDLSGRDLRGLLNGGGDGARLGREPWHHVILRHASLVGCRFLALRDCDLRGADLRRASMLGAALERCDLSGADMSELRNYAAVRLTGCTLHRVVLGVPAPLVPDLDRRVWAEIQQGGGAGQLEMGHWHTCTTSHCRAGWAIHLAGSAGYALEQRIGAAAAGAFIYWKSVGYVPDFYATNDEALADLRARAAS